MPWIRIALCAVCLGSPSAYAMRQPLFYFETGGGLSQIREANRFFTGAATGVGDTLGMGPGANFSLAINLGERNASAGYHLGLQGRYGSGSDASTSGLHLSLLNLYPFVRLEAAQIFFTLGVSPFAWQRVQPAMGLDLFSRSSGVLFGLVEVGYHHAVTPSISIGLVAAGQFASVGGNFSYNPYLSANAFLRFNYGQARSSSASESTDAGQYDGDGYPGWRYPYGMQK